MKYSGIIFDLDDTLIHSELCFKKIRRELNIPEDMYILDFIDNLSTDAEKERATSVVESHEQRAAEGAVLIPGVAEVLASLRQNEVKIGLFTRNCLKAASSVVEQFSLQFDTIITRNCAPAKPDPTGLLKILKIWGLSSEYVLYVGDFIFDIEAGEKAQLDTALYSPQDLPDYSERARFVFRNYAEFMNLVSG